MHSRLISKLAALTLALCAAVFSPSLHASSVRIDSSVYSVVERSGSTQVSATATLTRTYDPNEAVTLVYRTLASTGSNPAVSGSAAPANYVPVTSTTLTFPAGQFVQKIALPVTILNDGTAGGIREFLIQIASVSGTANPVLSGTGLTTVRILDSATPASAAEFGANEIFVSETDGIINVPVLRSGTLSATGTAAIYYTVVDGNAHYEETLTGVVQIARASDLVYGVGSKFKTELYPGDFIRLGDSAYSQTFQVVQVYSDTVLRVAVKSVYNQLNTVANALGVSYSRQLVHYGVPAPLADRAVTASYDARALTGLVSGTSGTSSVVGAEPNPVIPGVYELTSSGGTPTKFTSELTIGDIICVASTANAAATQYFQVVNIPSATRLQVAVSTSVNWPAISGWSVYRLVPAAKRLTGTFNTSGSNVFLNDGSLRLYPNPKVSGSGSKIISELTKKDLVLVSTTNVITSLTNLNGNMELFQVDAIENDASMVGVNWVPFDTSFDIAAATPSISSVPGFPDVPLLNSVTASGTVNAGSIYTRTGLFGQVMVPTTVLQTGVISFSGTNSVANIPINIVNDLDLQGEKIFTILLSSTAPYNDYPATPLALGPQSACSVHVVDDDVCTIQFQDPVYTVSEISGSRSTIYSAEIPVVRTGDLSRAASVSFITYPLTASPNVDYGTVYGVVSFNAWETTKSVSVPIYKNDQPPYGTKQFKIALMNPAVGYLGANPIATVNIADSQEANVVEFVTTEIQVSEQDGTALVPVRLNRSLGKQQQKVTVKYFTTPGTALPGLDYTPTSSADVSGTLTFDVSESNKYISIPILRNPSATDTLNFAVNLAVSDANIALGANSSAKVYIKDADSLGTVSFVSPQAVFSEGDGNGYLYVSLARSSTAAVSIGYDVKYGTAGSSRFESTMAVTGTITFPPKVSQTYIKLPLKNDDVVQSPEEFSVILRRADGISLGAYSQVDCTILDNDGDNYVEFDNAYYGAVEPQSNGTTGASIRLRATRNGNTNIPLAVDYEVVAGTALPGKNYVVTGSTAYFAAGDAYADIPVQILNDGQKNGTLNFTIKLKKNTTALGSFASVGRNATAQFRILDNDVNLNTFEFLAPEITVQEDGPALLIPVLRHGPFNRGDSSVYYQTSLTADEAKKNGESAIPGVNYQPAEGSLNYAVTLSFNIPVDQEKLKYISIPLIDDGQSTGDLHFRVKLTDMRNGVIGTQKSIFVTIKDAQLGNRVRLGSSSFTVTAGSTAQVTVVLEPTGNTAVTNSVDYYIDEGTAANGVDFSSPTRGTVLFSPRDILSGTSGMIYATIPIPTSGSSIYTSSSKKFTVYLFNPSSNVVLGDPRVATVVITNTNRASLPQVGLYSAPLTSIAVAGSDALVTISRTGSSASNTVVDLDLGDPGLIGSYLMSTDGSNYTALSTPTVSATIPANQTLANLWIRSLLTNNQPDQILPVSLKPSGVYNIYSSAASASIILRSAVQSGLQLQLSATSTPKQYDSVCFTMNVSNPPPTQDFNNAQLTVTLPEGLLYQSCDNPRATTATLAGKTVVTIPLGYVLSSGTMSVRLWAMPMAAVNYQVTADLTPEDTPAFDNHRFVVIQTQPISTPSTINVANSGNGYELTLLTNGSNTYLGSYPGRFTVIRDGDPSIPLDVDYQVISGTNPAATAAPGQNYYPLSGRVTFAPGESSASIPVYLNHDGQTTGDLAVTIQILPKSGYLVGSSSIATLTIYDADVPTVGVTAVVPQASELSASSGSVVSSTNNVGLVDGIFEITRSGSATSDLPLNLVWSGNAVNGTDYLAYVLESGTLRLLNSGTSSANGVYIPVSGTSAKIVIRPIANLKIESALRSVNLTVLPATDVQDTTIQIARPPAYHLDSGRTTASINILDKPTIYLTQKPNNSIAQIKKVGASYVRKDGKVIFNRMGSAINSTYVVPFTLSCPGVTGTAVKNYVKLYTDRTYDDYGAVLSSGSGNAVTLTPLGSSVTGTITFAPGVTEIPVFFEAQVRKTKDTKPFTMGIRPAGFYQVSPNSYRATVNLYSK